MVLQFPYSRVCYFAGHDLISAVRMRNVAHFSASDLELVAITLARRVYSGIEYKNKKLGFRSNGILDFTKLTHYLEPT